MTTPDEMDAADRDRALRIAEHLYAKTLRGELQWNKRDGRPHAFELDLPSGNVEVGTRDNDGGDPYDLRIFGPAPEFGLKAKVNSWDDSLDRRVAVIEELWKYLHRAGSGIDETLDGLLRDLGD